VFANLLVDLLLPATDRAVATQWIVMSIVWLVVFLGTWRVLRDRTWGADVRLLFVGIATMNLAWFAVRAVH
jgi:hypothetical protein